MSDVSQYSITVRGLNPTIVWMHARVDLENEGGGEVISEAPMEQRSADPVTAAVVVLVVTFGVSAAKEAGKQVVEAFAQKLRDAGGEVETDHREPGGYL